MARDSGTGSDAEPGAETRSPPAVSNAIAVLRCFSPAEPTLGVTAIAGRVGLHKSTVSRTLSTLEAEGLVERDPNSRRYTLGLGLISLAGPLLADLDVRRVAFPVLHELSRATRETTALMVWNGSESVCVEQIASPQQVKHTTPIGTRFDTAQSASVQMLLSARTTGEVRALLEAGAIRGVGDHEEFLRTLAHVAEEGTALNWGRTSADEVGVCAPVLDHRGQLTAAALIAAPRFRVSQESAQSLLADCRRAADDITRRLGGVPPRQ